MYNYTNADRQCDAKLSLFIMVFDESCKYCDEKLNLCNFS